LRGMIALAIGASLLAGCASSSRPPSRVIKQIDRALAQAPGKAQPSLIVKTELALNRMAREDGQVDAYRQYGREGAQIHSESGIEDIATVLARFGNPKQPSVLSTRSVFMSCDGSLAVSQGRGLDPNGKVGNYVVVWERQRGIRPNNEDETGYRFVYFSAEPDNPQPPPRKEPEVVPGAIVVEALDTVRADIASCRDRDQAYLEALAEPAAGYSSGSGQSLDRTLQWNWFSDPQGKRTIEVSLWRKGARETVLTQELPSAPR